MPNPFASVLRRQRPAQRPGELRETAFDELTAPDRPDSAPLPAYCLQRASRLRVAVVGGGLGGLMAARDLARQGVKVSLFEARPEVGGRVLSTTSFSKGRVIEAGAELIGTFHSRWKRLAVEHGLAFVNRMEYQQYANEGLDLKLTLDKSLSMKEIEDLVKEMRRRVLVPISVIALGVSDPAQPWRNTSLQRFDQMSVETALQNLLKISPTADRRLWMALEMLLVNDNGVPLAQMNFLGLLCLVKGGQLGPQDVPPMGYWDELEVFRCADGCQTLAIKMAQQMSKKLGVRVLRQTEVTHINLLATRASLAWRIVDKKGKPIDRQQPMTEAFDYVVLAVPPSVWARITFTPVQPGDPSQVGLMTMAPTFKFFSDVDERFWIRQRAAPMGGSPALGQVWEGTDNQTRLKDQGVVLSVFGGGRLPQQSDFAPELEKLYPGYGKRVRNTLLANWPDQAFIRCGCTAPALGQIFTVARKLNLPFRDRLFFAGDHTRMDLTGYMEGALASGESAATRLLRHACGLPHEDLPPDGGPTRLAQADAEAEHTPLSGLAEADIETDSERMLDDEVIAGDDRVRVADTLRAPQRWICAIDLFVLNPEPHKGGPRLLKVPSRASGTLIGPRHVLTARHVLDAATVTVDGVARKLEIHSLRVSPGRNGRNDRHPLGSFASASLHRSTPYRMLQNKTIAGQVRRIPITQIDDYALIALDRDVDSLADKTAIGYWGQTAPAQLRRMDPALIDGQEVIVNGYPGDRCGKDVIQGNSTDKMRRIAHCQRTRDDEWASTAWAARGRAAASQDSTDLFHTADTYGGQSGAPICQQRGRTLALVGVHTGPADASRNRGVRVTRRMLRELVGWINADAGATIARIDDDALVFDPVPRAAKEVFDPEDSAAADGFETALDESAYADSELDTETR
jgi:monoamine oxidase/V8-like Glu-specific endopeptidase